MPATAVVVFQKRGPVGQRVTAARPDVWVRIARDRAGFAAALAWTPFPIAVIVAADAASQLADLLALGRRHHATTLVVAPGANSGERLLMLEAGATAVLVAIPTVAEWGLWLRGLEKVVQDRLRSTG